MRLDYNIPKQMQAEALEVIDKVEFFAEQNICVKRCFSMEILGGSSRDL